MQLRRENPATEHKSIKLEYRISCEDTLSPVDHIAKLTWPSPAKNSQKSMSKFCGTRELEARRTTVKINTAGALHRRSSKTTMAPNGSYSKVDLSSNIWLNFQGRLYIRLECVSYSSVCDITCNP